LIQGEEEAEVMVVAEVKAEVEAEVVAKAEVEVKAKLWLRIIITHHQNGLTCCMPKERRFIRNGVTRER
jgi:hypothetical protein